MSDVSLEFLRLQNEELKAKNQELLDLLELKAMQIAARQIASEQINASLRKLFDNYEFKKKV
jgi:hypothetical protein